MKEKPDRRTELYRKEIVDIFSAGIKDLEEFDMFSKQEYEKAFDFMGNSAFPRLVNDLTKKNEEMWIFTPKAPEEIKNSRDFRSGVNIVLNWGLHEDSRSVYRDLGTRFEFNRAVIEFCPNGKIEIRSGYYRNRTSLFFEKWENRPDLQAEALNKALSKNSECPKSVYCGNLGDLVNIFKPPLASLR
jgi:hypothetical protein